MINLPSQPKLTPSKLLYHEDTSPFVKELLQLSRSLRRAGRLPEAQRRAQDAVEACQEPGANVDRAVALIHLADVHREMGRLGPALTNCQQAHRIFQRQASRYQHHNEAIAAYALGLVHQLLGSDMDALKWYQESGKLLERVKDDWTAIKALDWVEACTCLQRWTETLHEYLTAAWTRASTNLATRVWVPIISPGTNGDKFAIAELGIDKCRVERELTIDGESFRVQPLKGNRRISLEPGVEYYAMEIPGAAHASLGTDAGDYALVVCKRDDNKEGPGVLETLSGPEFGRFERDAGGNVNFVRTDTTVIGAKDIGRDQIRYIAALLKSA